MTGVVLQGRYAPRFIQAEPYLCILTLDLGDSNQLCDARRVRNPGIVTIDDIAYIQRGQHQYGATLTLTLQLCSVK